MKTKLSAPIWIALYAFVWLGFSSVPTASAHGLEAGQMSVTIDDTIGLIIASPYATAFPFADENGDGLLSFEELTQHHDDILTLAYDTIILRNESGEVASLVKSDVLSLVDMGDGDENAIDFVQIGIRVTWEAVPEVVDVEYTLFGSADERIDFFMLDNESETKDVIEGRFHSAETLIRLRGEGTPTPANNTIWLSGVAHVLSGYDHILFILALVLATAGLRKLLIPLTTFTLAHTITLAAVAFGFEPPIPTWLIEATIAASIAILAGIYLFGISADVWWIAALLGLVHGLGFGQALTASLGNLQQWGSTLIAITIGVELTHLAIALLGFGALQLIRNPKYDMPVRRLASVAILCVGLYWTFERIPL